MSGVNFDLIPDDAVGVMAFDNDDPMHWADVRPAAFSVPIESKSETIILLKQAGSFEHTASLYLGCIVSNDGSSVYWVNEKRPLP